MLMFPEAQKAAQEEIDRVVGSDRLPEMDDAPNCPICSRLRQRSYSVDANHYLRVTPCSDPGGPLHGL